MLLPALVDVSYCTKVIYISGGKQCLYSSYHHPIYVCSQSLQGSNILYTSSEVPTQRSVITAGHREAWQKPWKDCTSLRRGQEKRPEWMKWEIHIWLLWINMSVHYIYPKRKTLSTQIKWRRMWDQHRAQIHFVPLMGSWVSHHHWHVEKHKHVTLCRSSMSHMQRATNIQEKTYIPHVNKVIFMKHV